MEIRLTTTGTLGTVEIQDLSGAEFVHPITDLNLLDEFDEDDILDSLDVGGDLLAQIVAGTVTLTDENGNPITNKDDALLAQAIVTGVAAIGKTSAAGVISNAINLTVNRPSVGVYNYSFVTPLPNADYNISYAVYDVTAPFVENDLNLFISNVTTAGFTAITRTGDNGTATDVLADTEHSITVFSNVFSASPQALPGDNLGDHTATQDLDLADFNITGIGGIANNSGVDVDIVTTLGHLNLRSEDGLGKSAFVAMNEVTPVVTLGVVDGAVSNSIIFNLTSTQFFFDPAADLRIGADPGTAGFALTSQGAGVPPVWADPGDDLGNHTATQALDLAGFDLNNLVNITNQTGSPLTTTVTGGDYNLTATDGAGTSALLFLNQDTGGFSLASLSGADFCGFVCSPTALNILIDSSSELQLNSNAGTLGQVIISQGAGVPPIYDNLNINNLSNVDIFTIPVAANSMLYFDGTNYVPTVNAINVVSDDIQINQYPNTRDDGANIATALYVDATGLIQYGRIESEYFAIESDAADSATNYNVTTETVINYTGTQTTNSPASFTYASGVVTCNFTGMITVSFANSWTAGATTNAARNHIVNRVRRVSAGTDRFGSGYTYIRDANGNIFDEASCSVSISVTSGDTIAITSDRRGTNTAPCNLNDPTECISTFSIIRTA